MAVRFIADTPQIHARWTVTNKNLAARTSRRSRRADWISMRRRIRGSGAGWASGSPPKFPDNTDVLVTGITRRPREYMVYLPLRNGVTSLEIGVPKGTDDQAGSGARGGLEADRVLRHFDHAWNLGVARGHDACGDAGAHVQSRSDQSGLLRQRQDGAGGGEASWRSWTPPSSCWIVCRT